MKTPVELFSEWARTGKDEGMEEGHGPSVAAMLDFALRERVNIGTPFSFIDAGCGNGWVVRKIREHPLCEYALGIDGSRDMIEKADRLDPKGHYVLSDLMQWTPEKKVDLIHSMEVFYYFPDPGDLIERIMDTWLNPGGRLIMGVDHYQENKPSLDWAEECGTTLTTLSESEWKAGFVGAGLSQVKTWRVGKKDDWGGTLVVTGKL